MVSLNPDEFGTRKSLENMIVKSSSVALYYAEVTRY